MSTGIRNHIVVCGWNRRAAAIVRALRSLDDRTILVVHTDVTTPTREAGNLPNVFVMSGDPTRREVLENADVANAKSVLVLADASLGSSSDARSVKLALLVERIQPEVYTVVEVRDIQNKAHFAWTMVDDLITDQEIAVKMLAQGIRHALEATEEIISSRKAPSGSFSISDSPGDSAVSLVTLYRQLVTPQATGSEHRAELFRIDLDWPRYRAATFSHMLRAALPLGLQPVALVGYRTVGITSDTRRQSAAMWKLETRSNPPAKLSASQIWPEWPDDNPPLGVLVIGDRNANVSLFESRLAAK